MVNERKKRRRRKGESILHHAIVAFMQCKNKLVLYVFLSKFIEGKLLYISKNKGTLFCI
jgi:hypothetical protein